MAPMFGIVLDTNVVSALFHAQEDPNVKRWFLKQELESLYLTSMTLAEILFGIRKLVQGKRRETLEQWLQDVVCPNFSRRLLSFDQTAADTWTHIHAADFAIGKPRPLVDGYIGAIAKAHGFAIATRNQRDFERLDLKLINPFDHK
jgi:predicted nucleic acid-binding protein